MSLFHSFISSSPSMHLLITKDAMPRKGYRNRATTRPTPSIIDQLEEFHISTALTHQTNVIGILGDNSSLNFAKKLVDHGTEIPFVLCVDPALSNELLWLDRASFHCPSGKQEQVHINLSAIIENLRSKRAILEKFGVCCIVMPCHVMHFWQDEIKEGCSVPFIHMGESVAEELEQAKLRPIEAGSPIRIGVLATTTTLATRIYEKNLKNKGFEVVMPDKNTVKNIVIPAVEALSSKDVEGAQNLFRISLHILLVKAVNKIVLASDELRHLLTPEDPLWTKCIDPIDALARSAVKYACSHKLT